MQKEENASAMKQGQTEAKAGVLCEQGRDGRQSQTPSTYSLAVHVPRKIIT